MYREPESDSLQLLGLRAACRAAVEVIASTCMSLWSHCCAICDTSSGGGDDRPAEEGVRPVRGQGQTLQATREGEPSDAEGSDWFAASERVKIRSQHTISSR